MDSQNKLATALASKPTPLMANGLTEEETSATASVSGLSSRPVQGGEALKFTGVDDTQQMHRVRMLLESHGVHMGSKFIASLVEAAQPVREPMWQPIETAPKDGRKFLLTYKNSTGLPRIVVGGWVTDEEAAETDEDGVGLEAGWYERIDNWGDYYQVSINEGEPTHWMPLPAAPGITKE